MELRFMNADKPYFAIGFPNMAGGYEVRNRYFKGVSPPKDITISDNRANREMCVICSRASWITSRSSPLE